MSQVDAVARQQAALRALYRRHVGPGDRYALVDFPDHANVGDSAIWLGETRMLRAVTGRDPDYVATADDFDAADFRAASPSGVLFLHGGGNLGDIWPHHQRFRERMLEWRDRRIVQLPQSIHFRARDGIAAFGMLVARHPAFHLYVRDAPSLAFARLHWGCPVDLVPDSAFALGRQARGQPDCDVLMLMRTDDERIAHDPRLTGDRSGTVISDWLEDGMLPLALAGERRVDRYHGLADARVRRGLALLSRGRRVVTDRLHGHILATLLDIPHVALDNDYGKISAYIAAWTAQSPLLGPAAAA